MGVGLVCVYVCEGGWGHPCRLISASQPSFWKIDAHAGPVNGKQTFRVIKALVVTCERG